MFRNKMNLCECIIVGSHDPYIPLIPSTFFVGSTIKRLVNSGKVNGIMVAQADLSDVQSYPPNGFSPELKCPNAESSMYKDDPKYSCEKHQFNLDGNGILFEDLKMPVMLLKSQEEVDKVMDCYLAHNVPSGGDNASEPSLPLCAAELKAFMHAAGNSEICLRRNNLIRNFSPSQYCQELGGYSSLAFLKETPKDTSRNKTIVIISRTDSSSLFEMMQPGASSPAASMAILLSVAETLKRRRDEILSAGYNVLFLALTGESFDYIGSQKLVYDMQRDFFPNKTSNSARMNLADVHLIIELSQFVQLGRGLSSKIFYHTDPNTKSSFQSIPDFITKLEATSPSLNIVFGAASADQPLPPSSSQVFIRGLESTGVPVIVLADYNAKFKTEYYNSYLDTPEIQGVFPNRSAVQYNETSDIAKVLANVSTGISDAVVMYTTNVSSDSSYKADSDTVHHVLYCLLISPDCDLFHTVLAPKDVSVVNGTTTPFPFYVSVFSAGVSTQHIQKLMLQMLAYFTGDETDLSEEDCVDNSSSPTSTFWINGRSFANGTRQNVCIRSTAQYHAASSPAFEIEGYNFSSGLYSTWTESVWPNVDAFHVRIFLKPSPEVELASMVAGITLFIVAAIVAVLVQRRAAILFPSHSTPETLTTGS